jgi:hypothetical protein
MDIPRGHAAMPLGEADFMDFIYNYIKSEYAPIRSFWSTATADPRQPSRWINMGHELTPLAIRPANAQAQKDLESLDYFIRKWSLDASFVKGLVVRFAKYEGHDRLEKKLFECARLDLMVRKSLKEKHLIDALWPSPAPRNLSQELLQQGVQVRRYYGDMFNKYFRVLRSIDQFELRPEVDRSIKNSGTLMLVPFVDHLVLGAVDPIVAIVAHGAGYSNAMVSDRRGGSSKSDGYGEPGRFDIRFDAPPDAQDTFTKTVVRQCQCNKCGTKRDVQVVISVDPSLPGSAAVVSSRTTKPSSSSAQDRRTGSKTAQRYVPRYQTPASRETAPQEPPHSQAQRAEAPQPEAKKQCPRCTFLNHAELTACEMCQADLPDTTVVKPASPTAPKISHSHSTSLPPPTTAEPKNDVSERPPGPNRHSLSSTLFSIFPFSQQHQQEHHAKLPPTQEVNTSTATRSQHSEPKSDSRPSSKRVTQTLDPSSAHPPASPSKSSTPPNLMDASPDAAPSRNHLEMAMMPLTPSPPATSSSKRPVPAGLPTSLMDDFVPVSPAMQKEGEDEDAGWGEMSREEARSDDDHDEEEYEGRASGGLVDLDAVAREEADVWGERED